MNSSTVLRRVAGVRAAAKRPLTQAPSATLSIRSYATPSSQEPDPQLNGYPQLPWVSRQTRDPHGWQDPLLRRNFGEPLHEQEEVLSMWGPDIPPGDITPQAALRQLALAFAGFAAFGLLVKYVLLPEPPAVRREYPYDGLVKELGGLEENKQRTESTIEED
ncbi:hypothetical protein BDQ12DRAFT_707398 [Crucibulum laeve]|uniref:NADH:ubiquinone oxidoreductase 20.1kD subunit n=1 Tax=Crucibulum laeve TaxID=68775 RepID=A0A5C3LJF0_9AGAR|nr:hypothetical protein BDQ12DRAFT_707398 [Crucibulum laeve]